MGININYHRHRNHIASETDTKQQKVLKYIISFILNVLLIALSFSVCSELTFFSPYYLRKSFTSYEYTAELYKNIELYAENSCKRAGIDGSCIDDVVTFETVKSINDAYISEQLGINNRLSNETYDYYIGNFKDDINALLMKQLNIIDSSAAADAYGGSVSSMVNDIVDYIYESVSVSHTEKLMSAVSVAGIAVKAVIAVLSVMSVLFIVIIYYIGEKRYRGLRFVAYSFGTAALMNAAFAVIAKVYAANLDLQLYPKYLHFALESHINYCVFALMCVAAAMLAAYAAVLAFCWKLKRKNK